MDIASCLGVGCEQRSSCACYARVEWSDPRELRMSFCPIDERGHHTLYQPLHFQRVACVESERRAAA
jgi:hypothetical protein